MTSEERQEMCGQIEKIRIQIDYIKKKISNMQMALDISSDALENLLGHFPE